jgi:hypothetical protein
MAWGVTSRLGGSVDEFMGLAKLATAQLKALRGESAKLLEDLRCVEQLEAALFPARQYGP